MELISSDTNIWIDFDTIGYLDILFLLNDIYTFIMTKDTISEELKSPVDLCNRLLNNGLLSTELSTQEFQLSTVFAEKYIQLSLHDTFALSIAKSRSIKLLSGDKNLRKAAENEGVEVHGTLWVLDEVFRTYKLNIASYIGILKALESYCGQKIRLPMNEIQKRLISASEYIK